MKFRFEIGFYKVRDYEGATHKTPESIKKLREARQSLKKPCKICGKIVPLGRRTLCSEKCWIKCEQFRKHKKVEK